MFSLGQSKALYSTSGGWLVGLELSRRESRWIGMDKGRKGQRRSAPAEFKLEYLGHCGGFGAAGPAPVANEFIFKNRVKMVISW